MEKIHWKAILLLLVAVPFVNFLARHLGQSTGEQININEAKVARASPANRELIVLVSSQDSEGITQDRMDIDFLKHLEAYTLERVKANTREYRASKGLADLADLSGEITSDPIYAQIGPRKVGVIRIGSAGLRSVFVVGIVGREMKRVTCVRESEMAIPISYGPCGDKVEEVFGVRFNG